MTKIAYTGGGTVGHVSVNLSLIPTSIEKGHEAFYIGSKHGIEREMIESQLPNIQYYPISSGKLRRYLSFENAKDVFKVLKGILDARKILKKQKPDLLFSKGGFVSVPVVIAARSLKIPTIIHESDLTPGLANKIALKFAKKGSLGSKKLNNIIRQNIEALLHDYQIIHLTGKGLVDDSINKKGYVQFEFVKDDLTDLLAITDTVVSRAGSNAIYEFLTLRIPMLLIPLGLDQSRGDQIDNAKNFESKGYGRHIPEDQLTEVNLLQELNDIELHRESIIKQMETYQESYTKEDLFDKIIHDALNK
ncbi:MAG: UDP-N-acetylglucosamine--N-acetylmuramyl-(pentapeptide) pyrophosphoryl-undecaprenol N-acetylglucosamine transferase [Staphylococcus epidermidis]|nr:UDP-N-acetylglucosamine--N-acetylmuramyl-(pentapeptide) pyrophosphoryl-undecaprenol N-acetylglucosamine transferase [Staphylococcus epidermidis]